VRSWGGERAREGREREREREKERERERGRLAEMDAVDNSEKGAGKGKSVSNQEALFSQPEKCLDSRLVNTNLAGSYRWQNCSLGKGNKTKM
jgi:hypothetical protein